MNFNDSIKRLCNGFGLYPYKSISMHTPTVTDLLRSDKIVISGITEWYDVQF